MNLRVLPVVLLLALALPALRMAAATYFVDAASGADSNPGTSPTLAFKTLARASQVAFAPGDNVMLAAGQTFRGSLVLRNVRGTPDRPIVVGSYGPAGVEPSQGKATIDARGEAHGVWLDNVSHVRIENLAIEADGGGRPKNPADMRCGVYVSLTAPGAYADVTLENLRVRNVFFEDAGFRRPASEVKTANGTQPYGWGIRFFNRTEGAVLEGVTIRGCELENIEHTGIKFTTRKDSIRRVRILDNRVIRTGGPGVQFSGVLDGVVRGNRITSSGSNDDSRKWGRGSGLWTFNCTGFLIERNAFIGANGPADSAGCHIDFNCRDVVVQYNLSARNAGGFCEILGNNHNCAYRYNVSVDDGFRRKGENGAFQEGKTLWLSGYVGAGQKPTGPFNSYIYNNTIFTREGLVPKIAFAGTADGVLIANNIFYLQAPGETVAGDQNRAEAKKRVPTPRAWVKNNLFVRMDGWPADAPLRDVAPLRGDPQFARPGGLDPADYLPRNVALVRDRGIEIPALPEDQVGLAIGLKVMQDILGNPIRGRPDLGAIEAP